MHPFETPQSDCRFGIAGCDITPPIGIYHRMWGAATHDCSTGVHRPLTATAMAIAPATASGEADRDRAPLVIIAFDHCLLWEREMYALRSATSQATGVPRERLLFCFSHTHAAGLMGLERAELPGGELIAPYLATLAEHCTAIVRTACDGMQRATIVYGIGRCSLAAHRDLWDEASGQFVCGFNPAGPTDDTLLVARVTADDERVLATIVNYACHPTSLAWENTLINPDYPGAMREVIEAATGAPCMFLQGASGDLGPRDGYVGDLAVADRNGRQLGYAALSALESLPKAGTSLVYSGSIVSGATLGTWRHVSPTPEQQTAARRWVYHHWKASLPLRADLPTCAAAQSQFEDWRQREIAAHAAGNDLEARDCHAQAERLTRLLVNLDGLSADGRMELPVTLCRLGGAVWLFVEGEYYHVFQTTLRARHPQFPLVVATLANGWRPAYLPPADLYGRGIYQEQVALLAPGCLEQMIDLVGQQIDRCLDA